MLNFRGGNARVIAQNVRHCGPSWPNTLGVEEFELVIIGCKSDEACTVNVLLQGYAASGQLIGHVLSFIDALKKRASGCQWRFGNGKLYQNIPA